MPALEQAQYELKSARREILKLNKAIEERDVLVSDVLRENFELKQKLDEIQTNMQSRSYLQALLSAITDEEVDADA